MHILLERQQVLTQISALLHQIPHLSDCNMLDGAACSCGLDKMKAGWADYHYNMLPKPDPDLPNYIDKDWD